MRILTVRHKGLRRLIERGEAAGLPPTSADKLTRMIGFLQDVGSADELATVQLWKAHQLRGSGRGTWSLFVTRNWRLTFRIEANAIVDLDLEDDH